MRAIRIICINILLCLCTGIYAQSNDYLWEQARRLKNAGEYEKALEIFNKIKEDSSYKDDCELIIEEIMQKIQTQTYKSSFTVEKDVLEYSFLGGKKFILISSLNKVHVNKDVEWIEAVVVNSDSIQILCKEPNNNIDIRVAFVTLTNGKENKKIKIIQHGRPGYIYPEKNILNFSASGGNTTIKIESNTDYFIGSLPNWCEANIGQGEISINVLRNPELSQRNGEIIIVSASTEAAIQISQAAAEEILELSELSIDIPADGGTYHVMVNTNAKNWSISGFPTWLNAEKIGKDSLRIICTKNEPNGESRSESVQIHTATQTKGFIITQAPRFPEDVLFSKSKIVNGKNFSIGISANLRFPHIINSSGGEFIGSVVDYSLGNKTENAVYRDAFGGGIGIVTDIRLYRNIFITTGCDLVYIKYKNHFEEDVPLYMPYDDNKYSKADTKNNYDEKYQHIMLEMPILFSWRFKTSDISCFGFSLGPVLNIGLKSELHLSGTTGARNSIIYDKYTNNPLTSINTGYYTKIDNKFNLYNTEVIWEKVYTESIIDNSQKYKNTFSDSPLKRMNCSIRAGIEYEVAGFALQLSYTAMFTNMANKDFWNKSRWVILNEAPTSMSNYKQYMNYLELKFEYIFKY